MKKIFILVLLFCIHAMADNCIMDADNIFFKCTSNNSLLVMDLSKSKTDPIAVHPLRKSMNCNDYANTNNSVAESMRKSNDYAIYTDGDLLPGIIYKTKEEKHLESYDKCETHPLKEEVKTEAGYCATCEKESKETEVKSLKMKHTDEKVPVKKCDFVKASGEDLKGASLHPSGCKDSALAIAEVSCEAEGSLPDFTTVVVCDLSSDLDATKCYNKSMAWTALTDGKVDLKHSSETSK